jgi:hypothetical protein
MLLKEAGRYEVVLKPKSMNLSKPVAFTSSFHQNSLAAWLTTSKPGRSLFLEKAGFTIRHFTLLRGGLPSFKKILFLALFYHPNFLNTGLGTEQKLNKLILAKHCC